MGLDHTFKPWRIFFLITGGLTLLVAVAFWIWFPDNPTNARFLTDEEKIIAVERIRSNNAGIENKTWKRSQFIEAVLDWKVWAFALLAAINNLPNSLTTMSSQVIKVSGDQEVSTCIAPELTSSNR
jgi:MFS transporter, ACS family, allantoate permease